jgi:hypothetical protein
MLLVTVAYFAVNSLVTPRLPPAYKLPTIPAPPSTINAPVLARVDVTLDATLVGLEMLPPLKDCDAVCTGSSLM